MSIISLRAEISKRLNEEFPSFLLKKAIDYHCRKGLRPGCDCSWCVRKFWHTYEVSMAFPSERPHLKHQWKRNKEFLKNSLLERPDYKKGNQMNVEVNTEMVQKIVDYDENGNPIVGKFGEGASLPQDSEIEKIEFVQTEDVIN